MGERVDCPYCGSEIGCERIYTDGSYGYAFVCNNDECLAQGPFVDARNPWCGTPEKAMEAALRRYQPENRVLAFDEVKALDNDQMQGLQAQDGGKQQWLKRK